MKNLNTLAIVIILLSTNHLYNAEEQAATETANSTKPTIEEKEEKTDLQKWNDHLELLTASDDHWDTTTNKPTDTWEKDAFDLATAVLQQDKSLAATLKDSFLQTLNKKTTDLTADIINLVNAFNKRIDDTVATLETPQETKEVAEPAKTTPAVPEIVPSTPEPIIEQPSAQPETAPVTTTSESTSTTESTVPAAPATEEPKKDLETQWKEILESIKNEKEITTDSLKKAAEIARDRSVLNGYPQEMLERDLLKALSSRPQQTIDNAMNKFKMTMVYGEEPTYSYIPPQAFEQQDLAARAEIEKMRAELEAKDAKTREELEKQRQKEELERNKLLVAAAKAKEEGKITEAQLHKLAEVQKQQKEAFEEKQKELQQQATALSKKLAQLTQQQMAAAQKAPTEKGMFAKFTEAVGNWWYGAEDQAALSAKKQPEAIDEIFKGKPEEAKIFMEFQQTLLSFNAAESWNQQEKTSWLNTMSNLIKEIVITYNIMGLEDMQNMLEEVLRSSKLAERKIPELISKITKSTDMALKEQERQKAEPQKILQRRQQKREQLLLAQQKTKEDQTRKEAEIEAEQQKQILAANSYQDEKKQWYAHLDKVAGHKGATLDDNHAHTHEALKKSHSLLQLAGDIPDKNKHELSQKLKQKFTLALLEQQKNNDDMVNIHHHMDVFNKEINKMID